MGTVLGVNYEILFMPVANDFFKNIPAEYNTELNTNKYITQENGNNPQLIDILIKIRKQHNNSKLIKKTLIDNTSNKSTQKIATYFFLKKLKYNTAP